jgi:hypothetical protein
MSTATVTVRFTVALPEPVKDFRDRYKAPFFAEQIRVVWTSGAITFGDACSVVVVGARRKANDERYDENLEVPVWADEALDYLSLAGIEELMIAKILRAELPSLEEFPENTAPSAENILRAICGGAWIDPAGGTIDVDGLSFSPEEQEYIARLKAEEHGRGPA